MRLPKKTVIRPVFYFLFIICIIGTFINNGNADDIVSQIQQRLLDLRYSPGSPDGIVGEKTKTAIINFQIKAGLEVNGEPSESLLKHIIQHPELKMDKAYSLQNIDAVIDKWIDYFRPSAMSRADQKKELKWFFQAAGAFRGESIRSTAEHIKTHYWERDVLTKAFEEITGIRVKHEIIGEGDVVRNITEQMMTGRVIYDAYVNDADMIGTHLRLNKVVDLGNYMKEEGKKYTNPYLALDDFLNPEFGQDYDGNQLQLPDQQFANLYWFRYDWFNDPKTKNDFRNQFGYELGVPVNWAAYEDIAKFFTGRSMKNPDGTVVEAYGHLDYGKPSPSLGWRFTDAWLSIAGVGDKGLPNGLPVDEWGIRVINKIPVGSSVERGGALDGPAATYALTKYLEWLNKYAPPQSKTWEWQDAGPMAGKGNIAQRVFQYTTWLSASDFHKKGGPLMNRDGRPVWRVAPTPHGRYWDEGMKVGYQDAGSWTIPWNIRDERRAMAWLWAQFCVSKTVSLKKFLVGGTPVRKSTINNWYLTKNSYKYGGLIEFYRSPEEKKWTDSGPNVPHYPALSGIWWENIASAIKGEKSPQEAMTSLANQQDNMMMKLKLKKYAPNLNPINSREFWLNQPGAPKAKRKRPKPETIQYNELIKQWTR